MVSRVHGRPWSFLRLVIHRRPWSFLRPWSPWSPWSFMVVHGHTWLYNSCFFVHRCPMVVSSSLFMDFHGHHHGRLWSFMVVSLFLPIHCCPRSSMVTVDTMVVHGCFICPWLFLRPYLGGVDSMVVHGRPWSPWSSTMVVHGRYLSLFMRVG